MIASQVSPRSSTLAFALFATLISVLLSGIMLLMRSGLPTPAVAIVAGPLITGFATLLPALWASRTGRDTWAGPIVVLCLATACATAATGWIGLSLIGVASLAALARSAAILRANGALGARLGRWLTLAIATVLLAALIVAGNKYVNFFADRLLLWGRTDGDVMFHGAITNAYRYFHFPSTGVDGLRLLHYHTGLDALAALIAGGGNLDAVLALIVLRIQVLLPVMLFALAWAGSCFSRGFLPGAGRAPLALTTGTILVALLLQSGSFGRLILGNDPMLLSGVILVLLAPPVVLELIARGAAARLALLVAVLAVPILSVTKISTGAVWCALIGYLVLRTVGPKRLAFWLAGAAMALLLAGSFFLTSDPGESGAVLFGTPFYVEYGFAEGDYFFPLVMHLDLLAAIAGLLAAGSLAVPAARRLWIEVLVVTALAANVPGLVLQIPGGDAVFFLSAMNWIVAPLLIMLIAALPSLLRRAGQGRRLGWSLAALAILGLTIDAGIKTDDRVFVAVSGAALLHTGDAGYYASDKRRAWRADAQRAIAEHGLIGLFRLTPPPPRGASLQAALLGARSSGVSTSAYVPPESDYWNWIADCDGRSLWPMAAAGIPLIDGYTPVQAACPQEFAVSGYAPPPPVRATLDAAEVCRRATAAGLPVVLTFESVEDRSRDRFTLCPGKP